MNKPATKPVNQPVLSKWIHLPCEQLLRRGLRHMACPNCRVIRDATKKAAS